MCTFGFARQVLARAVLESHQKHTAEFTVVFVGDFVVVVVVGGKIGMIPYQKTKCSWYILIAKLCRFVFNFSNIYYIGRN